MLPSRIVTVGGGGFRDITERFDDRRPPGAGLAINEMMTMMSDGGAVVSVTIAEVVVRKMVYADGRFHVQIEEGRDRIAFAGSAGRASLTYGAETVSFVPDADPAALDRAREIMSTARVVATFRRLAERLGRTARKTASAASVGLTAALVAEVAGEPGIAVELGGLMSVPIRQHHAAYEKGNAFGDRWAERVGRLPPGSEQPDGTGALSQPVSSMSAAFRALLQLEAAWYATATSAGDTSCRSNR
jgi:hypothetical protein